MNHEKRAHDQIVMASLGGCPRPDLIVRAALLSADKGWGRRTLAGVPDDDEGGDDDPEETADAAGTLRDAVSKAVSKLDLAVEAYDDATAPNPPPEPKDETMSTKTNDAEAFQAMKPMERARLKRDDASTYQRMRGAWLTAHGMSDAPAPPTPPAVKASDGRAYEDLRPIERHHLKLNDRATFDAMRRSWIARGQPMSPPPTVA